MDELELVGYTADYRYLVFRDTTNSHRLTVPVDSDLLATLWEVVEVGGDKHGLRWPAPTSVGPGGRDARVPVSAPPAAEAPPAAKKSSAASRSPAKRSGGAKKTAAGVKATAANKTSTAANKTAANKAPAKKAPTAKTTTAAARGAAAKTTAPATAKRTAAAPTRPTGEDAGTRKKTAAAKKTAAKKASAAKIPPAQASAQPDRPRRPTVTHPAAVPVARSDSQLSPREIQSLLRAGRPPNVIARQAGIDEQRVERWLPPIEAERTQVIRSVLGSRQSKARLGQSMDVVGDALRANLAAKRVDIDAEGEWQATRQDSDDFWTVTLQYENRGRTQQAQWTYSADSGDVTPANALAADIGWTGDRKRRNRDADESAPARPAKRTTKATRTRAAALGRSRQPRRR